MDMEKSKFRHTIVSERFTILFASGVILIGLFVLIGWFSRLMFLTRFSVNEVPMAPSTAYVFIFMAAGLWFYLRPQKIALNRIAAIASAVIAICLSCLIVVTNILKYYGNWEHTFINIPETHLNMQLGHMSLVTAILFIISGFALLFLLSNRKIVKTFSIILTLIIFIISFTLLLAYAFGAPFFYFDNFIPPAVLTVLSFLMVSLALLAASDKNTFFVKTIWATSTSAKLLRIFLPTTIAITVIESLIIIRILPLLNIHPAIGVTLVSLIFVAAVIVVISILSKSMGKTLDSALENLNDSEERFRKISENAPVLINSFDKDGQCLFWNEQCNKTFGWSIEEINEQDVAMALFYPDPAVREEVIRSVTTDPDGNFREWHPLTKDGKILSIMWANFSLPNGQVFSMGHDITERKQAEQALLQSEATIKNKLKAITEPEGDIGTLELSDIIDAEALQSMMENFYQLTGMLGAILDISGKVLVAVGWQDICTKFHRCNPDSRKNCIESDTILTQGVPEGTFKSYRCKNNMWDIVTPIMVGGRHLGNVFMGQYFLEDELPDYELFREQARKYGFDEKEYLAALDRVPHFSKETVEAGMQFYSKLARIISTLSFSTIQQSRMLSEQKKSEQELQESNEKYLNLMDSLGTGVILHAPDTSIVLSNPKASKILGISPEQMQGKKAIDPRWRFVRYDGTDMPLEEYPVNKALSLMESFSEYFIGIKRPDRKYITWVNVNASLVFDENKKIKYVTISFNDITERKQAEQALKESEEKLNLIINSSPIGICTVDPLGNFSTTNLAYEQMVGYSKEECRGLSFFDVTHPDDRPKNKNLFQSMFSLESTSFSMEKRYIRKDGSEIDVAVNAIGIMDAEGNVRFGTAFVDDITERKRAEEALRESEAKLTALFTSLTEMVVMHELVLNDASEAIDYRIIDCNTVFTEFTGISKEDALGKLASQLYQTTPPPYLDKYAKVALGGDAHEFTTYYAPLDKHLMISVVSPQAGKFATITTDISAMMEIQEMIIAKNKEMENYLYVASHDLRTPLVNIQGFSQRLKKQADSIKSLFADKTLEPEILHQLGIITDENIPKTLRFVLSNIEKMDTLINGLLQLSRTGRIEMNIQKIDMNALFANILQSLDFQIKEAQCKIHIHPLPVCYGDAALLDQLFANIISNALKYSDSERALEITVDAKKRYNRIVYTISDNGKGISQKHLEHIWDVFYRIDPRSDTAGEGIGLSLVKRIAEKHKGKVWAESEENKGSAFYIELHNRSFIEI
jgi:PAS domain S-box-containing protein